jgi:hypothetical protein
MPSNPFIDPTRDVRLSLPGDDWIEIHEELTVGQLRDLSRAIRPAGSTGPDYAAYPIARVLAYVSRWSFVDASGQPAPISAGALEFMRPSIFNAIVAAIDAHETAREEKKPTTITSSATASDRILQSVG